MIVPASHCHETLQFHAFCCGQRRARPCISEPRIVGSDLRKFFMLALGWVLTLVGIVVTPMPIPIPLIGLLPLMAGPAILIHYSRPMRPFSQRLRHRVRLL